MKKKLLYLLPIFLIVIAGIITRFFGINWDQGYHLHPDERAIILFTLELSPPSSFREFISPESPWNPHFFAYGSLPLYLLYSLSSLAGFFFPWLTTYDGIVYVGRSISAIADIGIILLLYTLGKKYFSRDIGLYSSLFYLLSTFALQVAHFYAVDTLLTLFCLLSLYMLLEYNHTNKKRKLTGFAVFFGFALCTKISAIVLLLPYIITLFYHMHNNWQNNMRLHHIFFSVIRIGSMTVPITLLVICLCMPYAIIDFPEFLKHTTEQSAMTKSAWTFPYTLQYVGKIPYIYEISQIFFWGQGPFLATLSISSIIYVTIFLLRHPQKKILGIILSFFWVYFLIVGSFAIGFMRYMLPLYPILCLTGAIFFIYLLNVLPKSIQKIVVVLYCSTITILPISFLQIYTRPNTKVQATEYITQNIPKGSHLAVEHWDDQIPLSNADLYQTETLELYLEDTPQKWSVIDRQLGNSHYIILASNRLYTPLGKLTTCQKLLPHPCYKKTAEYYTELFSGKRGFEKIAEFSSYPTIPLVSIPLNDQSADESFTVYDHSKVIILKKTLNPKP